LVALQKKLLSAITRLNFYLIQLSNTFSYKRIMHHLFPKSLLLFTLILLISKSLLAQQSGANPGSVNKPGNTGGGQGFGVVSGALHDAVSKEHIEYGSIALYAEKDSALITGSITDAKGKFIFSDLATGKYYIKASYIGYEVSILPGIIISQQNADVKLGDIFIKPQLSTLSGVEIVAQKSLISNNLDKKVITVDKSMALSGGTATDIMENVPSVAVDAEGNVSLRGNTNITLLIDGKPASEAGISSSDILNQLPASAIEAVEVITNPSVRYDPDGTSGIINIVLKKKALQGFNGQVSGTIGTNDKYNGSFNLNYRTGKFNAFIGIDGRYNLSNANAESIRTSNFGEGVSVLAQNQEGTMNRNSLNFSGGIDYFIDTRNNLTISVQRRKMLFGQDGTIVFKNYYPIDTLIGYFDRYINSDRSVQSMNYSISYKHLFTEKGREFTQDIVFNDNDMTSDQQIDQQDYDVTTLQKSGLPDLQYNYAVNKNYFLSAQGNYIHPFANGARVETGYKVSFRDMSMDYDYTYYNYNTGEWDNQEQLKNHYDYQEQIYAVYGIYGNSWGKLRYQAGLRYEQVYTNSQVEQTDTTYKDTYYSLYPSLHTQYDLGKGRELQFSYSRRVDRPSPRELNPYVDYSDSLNIRQGNPELQPEYTNSLELGVMKYWGKYSVTSTAFFRNTTGMVEDVTTIDSSGITYTMPQNINNSKSYGFEFVVSANPYKWMRINGNLSLYKSNVSAVPEYDIPQTESFSWSGRINATLNYSENGSFQLIGNYMSPERELQSKEQSNYWIDISTRYDFFKGKLSATLRLTDIFNTRNHNSVTVGSNFTSVNKRYMESRVLYAGLQLKINNYNRKTEKDRINGDIQEDGF
jgi:outer membrane receptor protein involved in Fe transport